MSRIERTITRDSGNRSGIDILGNVLHGKWKLLILWSLSKGALRYTPIRKSIPDITDRMLSQTLRELIQDGFIVFEGQGHKKVYFLNGKSEGIIPALVLLNEFGESLKPKE